MSSRLSVVNWRPGGVSEFESFWSIGQKYAYLNRVRLEDFVETMHPKGAALAPYSHSRLKELDRVDPARLGALLQEPRSRFSNSSYERFLPKIGLPGRTESWGVYEHLRYCPACLKRGFHSVIHQLPWFERCLVHSLPLQRGCPKCARWLQYQEPAYGYGSSRHHRVMQYRCPCGQPLWEGIEENRWQDRLQGAELKPIRDYLAWLDKLANQIDEAAFRSAMELLCTDNRLAGDEVVWILQCLMPLYPPPKRVMQAFCGSPIEPFTLHIRDTYIQSHKVVDAIQRVGYRGLLHAYRGWEEALDETPVWHSMVKKMFKRLRSKHIRCESLCHGLYRMRRLSLYGERKSPGAYSYCPYIQSSILFENAWFLDHGQLDRLREWSLNIALKLAETDVVKLELDDDIKDELTFFPMRGIKRLRVTPALRRILDQLWIFEVLRVAHACSQNQFDKKLSSFDQKPFPRSAREAPFVMFEADQGNGISFKIWVRHSHVPEVPSLGRRRLQKHLKAVENQITIEARKAQEFARKLGILT